MSTREHTQASHFQDKRIKGFKNLKDLEVERREMVPINCLHVWLVAFILQHSLPHYWVGWFDEIAGCYRPSAFM